MNLKKVILLVTPMILTLYFCAADIPIVTSELEIISSKVFHKMIKHTQRIHR